MFKQGDYIVVLKDSSPENNWKNFVIKQIKNYNEIMPVVTPLGRDNSDCDQSYSYFTEKNNVWRYANEEEIEYYNQINKPFDTSKFEKFKEHVLKQSPVKHKYLTELLEKLKVE